MRLGDSVKLRKNYNVSTRIGNVGLYFGEGTCGVVLKSEKNNSIVEVGFPLNETITIGVLVDIVILEIIE